MYDPPLSSPVEGHGCGPAVPGASLPQVLDQVQDRCRVFREGQSEEILLHSIGGYGGERAKHDVGWHLKYIRTYVCTVRVSCAWSSCL